MWLPLKIFFVILHILALPLHCISLSILLFYNLTIRLLAKIFQDFVEPIPGADSVFLADNIWSRPHSSIIVGVQVHGTPTIADIAELFQKVYNYKDQGGRRCYRELGYYLIRYFGYGFWKQVPDFAIAQRIHIIRGEPQKENGNIIDTDPWSAAPSPPPPPIQEEEPLNSMVEGMLRKPYARDQPLWDVYLLYNYMGNPNVTLVLLRFHHLMADGISLVKLFYALIGAEKLPETFTKPSNSLKKWDQIANSLMFKISTAVSVMTVGFVDYIYEVFVRKERNSLFYNERGKLKLTTNWICYMSSKLDILEMKRASRQYGCSIAHIILAGIASGMERYFEKYHKDQPMPEGFHYALPLPVPKHPDLRLVNHWCMAQVHAKFGFEKNVEKMEYYKEETKRCARDVLPTVTALTFQYITRALPTHIVDLASKTKAAYSLLLSNIVGPQDNSRLGDFTIMDMFFFLPIVQEGAAIAVGAISCNGKLRITLTADTGSIPDRSRLEDLGMMVYTETRDICKVENIHGINEKTFEFIG